jgi:hypothetical protein
MQRGEPAYAARHVHIWLAVLARYLHYNAATNRTLAGRRLSGTDLIPHELWPLAGSGRLRMFSVALIAFLWVSAATVELLTHIPDKISSRQIPIAIALVSFATWTVWSCWHRTWPRSSRLDLGVLQTHRCRRSLAGGMVLGLAVGAGLGQALGIALGLTMGSRDRPGRRDRTRT